MVWAWGRVQGGTHWDLYYRFCGLEMEGRKEREGGTEGARDGCTDGQMDRGEGGEMGRQKDEGSRLPLV